MFPTFPDKLKVKTIKTAFKKPKKKHIQSLRKDILHS